MLYSSAKGIIRGHNGGRVEKGVLGAGWLVMTFKKDIFSPLSNGWITGSRTSTVSVPFLPLWYG